VIGVVNIVVDAFIITNLTNVVTTKVRCCFAISFNLC